MFRRITELNRDYIATPPKELNVLAMEIRFLSVQKAMKFYVQF
jgi:hypothetical protein